MPLVIKTISDIELAKDRILQATIQARSIVCNDKSEPLDWLSNMKFRLIGLHPYEHRPLNIIEQVNQTFTYLVALEASRKLLELHPNSNGYHLAPGAHASQVLDIMSVEQGLVGAECFAAVSPNNNGKLKKDLAKLMDKEELHKYVFFSSPSYPMTKHLSQFDLNGVQVWSLLL